MSRSIFDEPRPALSPDARKRSLETNSEEGQDYCRICRGEGSDTQPLYYPCKCSGSIKFVHQECLMEWLSHSQKKYCELCKTSFRFTKLYDRSMPATLPLPLFLRQLARHSLRGISRWLRYLIVGLIWICCLPWCIRQVWRGLFWLADGNWLEEGDVDLVGEAGSNATTGIASMSSSSNSGVNLTLPEYLERIKLVFPPMQISLADIFRVFFTKGLFGRGFQLVFSLFIPRSNNTRVSADGQNATYESSVAQSRRSPSLLSNVQFLATWSNSRLINNATVDIAEGQLICILLVAAFILVFLIREWVINQQPILNMPDPDLAENPVPERRAEEERPQIAGARLRNPRHGVEVNGGGEVVREPGQRPIAIPRPRRALVEEVPPHGLENEGDQSADTSHAQNLISEIDALSTRGIEVAIGESSAVAADVETRPIRRHSSSSSVPTHNPIGTIPNLGETGLDDYPLWANASFEAETMPEVFDFSTLDQGETTGAGHTQRRVSFAETDQVIGGRTSSPSTLNFNEDITDSDEAVIPTPESSDAGNPAPPPEHPVDGGDEQPTEPDANSDSKPLEETSTIGQLFNWLWHTEFPDEQPRDDDRPPMEDQDDEHIVQDVLAEDPFVPVQHLEALQPAPEVEVPPVAADIDAQAPNVLLGVDLNDPNADDAEDLDGVLELLGMEGPIFGMIQNVVFSLFLITLTLSASVWCPYIWGKIALLFLSKPTGMLIKAPLFVLSRSADIVVDIIFFVIGLAGFLLNMPVKLVKAATLPFLPSFSKLLDTETVEGFTLDLSQKSGGRLERTLSGAILSLKPDLPTFSMQSHYALLSFKASIHDALEWSTTTILQARESMVRHPITFRSLLISTGTILRSITKLPGTISRLWAMAKDFVGLVSADLTTLSPTQVDDMDPTLVEWGTEDRILTIILGYAFFAIAGIVFLEIAHLILGLKEGEKVEGYFADSLRQAGGVMKVIVIIGIEMLVFPLYCGLLLDIALLPLFANATLANRVAFMLRTPLTGIFIHWFIGTCYMFHFALFVSICRKIMRKGVLYFIRDPDDPTFHPVRDVLERPVPAQLGKIAFSALVYGGLVIVCLGGVVWSLNGIGGILPIQWATPEPRLAFPIDIVFYNFLLPFVLRKAEPSKKIAAMYKWWFRGCAKSLRLTHFLFGEEQKDETLTHPPSFPWNLFIKNAPTESQRDGIYVRAPASDSVRIPKGRNVFLEVTEQNERKDGQADSDHGMHGKKDAQFIMVYLPPNFKSRIATFIFLLWLFAAATGVAMTIGPLLVGRKLTKLLSRSPLPPNDLYAFTVGIHVFAAGGYAIAYIRPVQEYLRTRTNWFGKQLLDSVLHVLGLAYLGAFTALVLPLTLAMITELYIHIPIFTYLEINQEKLQTSTSDAAPTLTATQPVATIFILQSWTIGLLYLRLLLRLFTNHIAPDSRPAIALRAITRNGYLRADVGLASRAFVLPVTVICLAMLAFPLGYARLLITVLRVHDAEAQMRFYRMAYPSSLGLMLLYVGLLGVRKQLASWRVKIRDEVYLIGERLHNFHESKPKIPEMTGGARGKEKAL